ncbi:MAG: DUF1992 domain-containing protein [Chloroflexi bacterium]|nr:DUF1992 domain-containing protein [Chloroflexota bacterium]
MSPLRHEGGKRRHVDDWGSHVDRMIQEAQQRGEFDNLPGTGKPLQLDDDNPYEAEWATAFRVAKNAGAAPLWVELDREIGADAEALQAMLERTAGYFAAMRRRGTSPPDPLSTPVERGNRTPVRRLWWPFGRSGRGPHGETPRSAAGAESAGDTPSPAALEAERLRARALYVQKAAELDRKIQEFNAHKPRGLAWIEKPRLLPEQAGRRFDTACPPVTE